MLLIAEGLLTVQQEVGAGILIPSVLESSPVNKKRKLALELEPSGTEQGESSAQQSGPTVEVALIQPALLQTKDHHPCIAIDALQVLLAKIEQTNCSIETTFWEWSMMIPKQAPDTEHSQQNRNTNHIELQKLQQELADMAIQKEQLMEKLGCLQEQHL